MTTSPTAPIYQSTNLPSPNPYVGPRTFSAEQRHLFFGREREARDLLARVLSERLLLFYAQSGAGKSSLLHTRLIPQLREEKGFGVLPVGRVSGELPPGVGQVDNIFVFNLLLSIDQGGEPGAAGAGQPGRLPGAAGLARRWWTLTASERKGWVYDADAGPRPPAQVQAPALRPDRRPVRGDHHQPPRPLAGAGGVLPPARPGHAGRPQPVGGVDAARGLRGRAGPLRPLCFDRLRGRFYMERMDVDAALEAMREPAKRAAGPLRPAWPRSWCRTCARCVCPARRRTPGQYVEPVQLQVVCYQLWENLERERKN